MVDKALGLVRKLKPTLGPIHREAVNLGWLFEIHGSSLQTGFYLFQSLERNDYVYMLDGTLQGEPPEEYDLLSFYKTTRNFLIHAFHISKEMELPLNRGNPVWINLESLGFNIREFFRKLDYLSVTGFAEIEDRVKKERGYLFLQNGVVVGAKTSNAEGLEAFKQIVDNLSEHLCIINLYSLQDVVLSFLLSEPKLVLVEENLQKAKFSAEKLSRRLNTTPTLLVSVSAQNYGYRIFIDGSLIHEEAFEEDAPFFEVYGIRNLKTFDIINPEDHIKEKVQIKIIRRDYISQIIYFCPACWSVISQRDEVCPNCNYDLREFHQLPYEYKLLMGLEHPVTEMRINVIHTVGMKNLKEAIPQLEIMAVKESNPIVLTAIVDALSKMNCPEAIDVLRKLSQHPYAIVRSRAKLVLEKKLLQSSI